MHDAPSPTEMISAVKSFMDTTAAPQLTGHAAFHARVASNVLATLLRELEQRPAAEKAEASGLRQLLEAAPEASLEDMNRELCRRLQAGTIDLSTPGLLEHLKTTTIAQLSIDQPNYSGLKAALGSRG